MIMKKTRIKFKRALKKDVKGCCKKLEICFCCGKWTITIYIYFSESCRRTESVAGLVDGCSSWTETQQSTHTYPWQIFPISHLSLVRYAVFSVLITFLYRASKILKSKSVWQFNIADNKKGKKPWSYRLWEIYLNAGCMY